MKNAYKIYGKKTIIFTTLKNELKKIIIDTSDLEMIKKFSGTWFIQKYNGGHEYAIIATYDYDGKGTRHNIKMHRAIMNPPRKLEIDHINHNGLDNRKTNLRIVTHLQNSQNLKTQFSSTTGMRGVNYHKKAKQYIVRIHRKNKLIYSKFFPTKSEAIKAVLKARKRLMPFSVEARL